VRKILENKVLVFMHSNKRKLASLEVGLRRPHFTGDGGSEFPLLSSPIEKGMALRELVARGHPTDTRVARGYPNT
jgi:hypothetical protein